MHECKTCIEIVGLNAIGKKGIIIVAKSLSAETLAENRAASLDIIEVVLKRMNGDVQKLFRVCGKSNISNKARDLVEERWAKHNPSSTATGTIEPSDSNLKGSDGRSLSVSASQKKNMSRSKVENDSHSPSSGIPVPRPSSSGRNFRRSLLTKDDNTPSFNLPAREGKDISRDSSPYEKSDALIPSDGPFTFKYHSAELAERIEKIDGAKVQHSHGTRDGKSEIVSSRRKSAVLEGVLDPQKVSPALRLLNSLSDSKKSDTQPNNKQVDTSASSTRRAGAAASLRARLQQIRDKHRNTPGKLLSTDEKRNEEIPSQVDHLQQTPSIQASASNELSEKKQTPEKTQSSQDKDVPLTASPSQSSIHRDILALLESPGTVSENNPVWSRATDALRKLHASISKSAARNTNEESESTKKIRNDVLEDTSTFVGLLTRYV